MYRLDYEGEVERPAGLDPGRILDLESDPVRDAVLLGILPGQLDGRLVRVYAENRHLRVGLGDGDGGPAHAAGRVEDPGRRIRLQSLVNVRDARQVLGP